jgi:hypothetical protein
VRLHDATLVHERPLVAAGRDRGAMGESGGARGPHRCERKAVSLGRSPAGKSWEINSLWLRIDLPVALKLQPGIAPYAVIAPAVRASRSGPPPVRGPDHGEERSASDSRVVGIVGEVTVIVTKLGEQRVHVGAEVAGPGYVTPWLERTSLPRGGTGHSRWNQ